MRRGTSARASGNRQGAHAAIAATIVAWTALVLAMPRTDAQRYVTVIDADGRPVLGLSHEDFALKDGGVRRPIVSVEPATAAISAAVVVRGFSSTDMGDVASAIDTLQKTRAATPNSPALQVHQATGDQPLPSAIADAAHSLLEDGFDRRMVLAIVRRGAADGAIAPDASADVVDALTTAKAALWTIEVGPGGSGSSTSSIDTLLSSATDASGSVRTKVKSSGGLADAARDVFYLWRGQYLVTYTWPDPMLSFFKLEVRHDRGVVLTTGWER